MSDKENNKNPNPYAGQIVIEFELPIGYTPKDGEPQKLVRMRRIKNSDIIALQSDIRLRELAKEKQDVYSGNMVEVMLASASTLQMFCILFSRTVNKIGDISNPGTDVFQDLYQEDMTKLMTVHAQLNGNEADGKNAKYPFAGSQRSKK